MNKSLFQKYKLPLLTGLLGLICFFVLVFFDKPETFEFVNIYFIVVQPIAFALILQTVMVPDSPMTGMMFVIASSLAYHASAYLASNPSAPPYSYIIGGALGAALLLLIIIVVLKKSLPWASVAMAAIAGGISFLPFYFLHPYYFGPSFYFISDQITLGLSLFLWCLTIGSIIHFYSSKMNYKNMI